ncbi:hypothetical protein BLNAU_18662 [Blattamonas nauphoetae]|uniref:Uncharacterized protein n=1 Tax=Blattamonas nauphoetae TaxID=2049346 RepID=A0ABQ9X3R3_9EUKA|nr:hypothetical protein BLNAU_18662 [Blattamonas nauphoetae]
MAVVYRSLVATAKLQPTLNLCLEAKAVQFLEFMTQIYQYSGDAFLSDLGLTTDKSLADFVQSIVVLISSPSLAIIKAAMGMLRYLIVSCSQKSRLALVKADLISQLIVTLHPLSLSFADAVDIHTRLITIIDTSVTIATPDGLSRLKIKDGNGQQNVHETVLKQVLAHSEKYIWHLCVNRYSIIDGEQSKYFLLLLINLLQICPSYQPTMEFILHMPIFVTIPSCLTFIETDESIYWFLASVIVMQQEWNKTRGEERQTSKEVHRMLRMEGIEDLIEAKLRNDQKAYFGKCAVAKSIEWNNQLGMNLPKLLRIVTLSRQSPSVVAALSFTTHTLPLPSASPSPPTPSHSPLPLPLHPHPPTPLCLSLTTHTLPLPSASPSPPTPSLSPLPLPLHPHPPTPLCLSLTTHTLPLPSASPSPPTPSHSPLPLLSTHTSHSLCLSLTTHTLPLPLPLPHHPRPPTPLCLSLSTHTLPLPSASPSPPTPSHSPLPLPHHPHPPTPLCLSLFAKPTPTGLERRARLLFPDFSETNTSQSSGVQKIRPTEHRHRRHRGLPRRLHSRRDSGWTHDIVAFTHSMCRYCLVTPRTAGDTEVPVDSVRVKSEIGTGSSE